MPSLSPRGRGANTLSGRITREFAAMRLQDPDEPTEGRAEQNTRVELPELRTRDAIPILRLLEAYGLFDERNDLRDCLRVVKEAQWISREPPWYPIVLGIHRSHHLGNGALVVKDHPGATA